MAQQAAAKTNSGMSFSSVASDNGYEDNLDSMMPAGAWFTSAFGLSLSHGYAPHEMIG